MLRTNSHVWPGVRLHLLTFGISAYTRTTPSRYSCTPPTATRTTWPARSQASLHQVKPEMLLDKDATKSGIIHALTVMRAGMEAGGDNDLALVNFSGHGAMMDHKHTCGPTRSTDRDRTKPKYLPRLASPPRLTTVLVALAVGGLGSRTDCAEVSAAHCNGILKVAERMCEARPEETGLG
jgi:hypothetical protein